MRTLFTALGLLALYGSAQADSLTGIFARDSCGTSMSCDAAGCLGINNATASGDGYCTEGDCVNQLCKSTCGPAGPCGNDGCNGFLGDGGIWTCSAGDYNGCVCNSICPPGDQIPNCSDSACNGASNTGDKYGICGLGNFTDCTCKNSCPSTKPKCSDSGCLGINDPTGGDSICLYGDDVGCACTSQCPTGKCNEIQDCAGINNVGGNSTCTNGPSLGCYCDPICPDQKMSCTANGCSGVQNATDSGDGFCTDGDYTGCACASQCPGTKPACTDRTCDGFNGKCTLGDALGCACSGNDISALDAAASVVSDLSSVLRGVKTVSSAAVRSTAQSKVAVKVQKSSGPVGSIKTRTTSGVGIPYAYYVCTARPGQSNSQGTDSWARDEIQIAMRQGWIALQQDEPVTGSNGQNYPRPFYYQTGWNIPDGVDVNDLWEFPLTRDRQGIMGFAHGQDPGPDRVVFQGSNMRFVGVFTHRGESNNRFHQAAGHTTAVNDPPPSYAINGPTNLDGPSRGWLPLMYGSGDLPFKRDTPDTPGSPTASASSPSNSPSLFTPVCGTGQGTPPSTYSVDYGNSAIAWFCGDSRNRIVSASGSRPMAIYGYQDKPGQQTNVDVIMRTYLINGDGCSATGSEIYQPSQQECTENFSAVMNNCQTDTTSNKAASYQAWNKGASGCVAYDLMPCPQVDGHASSVCQPSYGNYLGFKVGG